MEVNYLGHSSFRIKGKTATVITDPFDPKMVGLKFSGVAGDIVTISHDHNDHNQADKVKGVKKVISGPGEYEISGVSILGFPSFHDDKKGESRGKNTIYILEVDGVRIAHLGDLGHLLSESLINEMGDIDILMIPVGGEYTIGPTEATKVVQSIEPYFVIPMHYQNPGLNPEVFAKLEPLESFLSEVGLSVEKLPKFQLKKEDLTGSEGTRVVVLETK